MSPASVAMEGGGHGAQQPHRLPADPREPGGVRPACRLPAGLRELGGTPEWRPDLGWLLFPCPPPVHAKPRGLTGGPFYQGPTWKASRHRWHRQLEVFKTENGHLCSSGFLSASMEAPAEEGRAGNPSQPRETSQQLQSYITWVNSQLKKKPEVQPVQDLRHDLRNGVVLASLIEIVAGEKLSGVEVSPTNQQAMKKNVEKVLQFVASKKIRMHQTSATDIVDGNLKCIMRLILALAAHFKPGSGKIAPSSAMEKNSGGGGTLPARHRPRSAVATVHGAVAALAEVRQDILGGGRDAIQHHPSNPHEEIERPHWSVRALVQQYEGQQSSGPSESSFSSLTSPSPINSAKSESGSTPSEEKAGFDLGHEEEDGEEKAGIRTATWSHAFPELDHRYVVSHLEENGARLPIEWSPKCPAPSLETSWEEHLLEQQDHLEKEMEEAKRMISGLQALLLNGSLPEDEQEQSLGLCEQEASPEEQLVILRSRLDQSLEENQDLKKELQACKQDSRNLQGIKDALQQRLAQQDTLMLQIKQELLRANMDKEELHSQNADLQRKVEERNRLLAEYKKELSQKDRLLHQHQAKMEEMLHQLSEAGYQQAELERELQHKEALLARCLKKDVEEQVILYANHNSQSNGFLQTLGKGTASSTHRGTSDLQLVREALRSLRNSFSGHDPQHHTIDSLEQGISSLMERLHRMEMQKRQDKRVRGKSPAGHVGNECRESWPSNSKLPHSHSTPAVSSGACTKVLYFTDRSLTPFMVSIPKRLGEVTLRDFKAAIDRDGTHRYHFKALDPEFGTVKEEVFHDDDLIPGWEGKIVAWVEEDHGEN
ncbi:dixin isoform X3 [Crotalus tigris]|uniref:dixin isoform X3 n=1 Tax=Crotalus tigris TaxID=88082 RepID=UPI00192F1F12|nr:dixin isoform X3 [Crotalus tigris]